MAKAGESSFVEKHVEKGLLIICLLLLGYVIMHWVMDTPREIKVPGNISPAPLKPGQADAVLNKKAGVILNLNNHAEAKASGVIDPHDLVEARQSNPTGKYALPIGLTFGNLVATPYIPVIPRGATPRLADLLARRVKPLVPKVEIHREFADKKKEPSGIAAHVASVIPWREQDTLWKDALQNTTVTFRALVLRVDAEVQERPIGSEEWSKSHPVPMTAMPLPIAGGEGEIVLPRDIPKVPDAPKDKTDLDAIGAIENDYIAVIDQYYQKHILQPDYYPLFWGPTRTWHSWTIHLPKTIVTEPTGPAGVEAGDGKERDKPVIPGAAPVIPGQPSRPRVIPAGRPPYVPGPDGLEEPGMIGPDMRTTPPVRRTVPRTTTPGRTRTTPPPVRRPTGRERYGPGLEGLEEPGMMRPGRRTTPPVRRTPSRTTTPPRRTAVARGAKSATPPAQVPQPPQAVIIPELEVQKQMGKVLIAFHQNTGLAPRMEYRYRVKVAYLNPLFLKFADVDPKNEADARVRTIETEWSEWSAPASVPQATEFYLAGAMQTRYVSIAVYATCFGQRVKEVFKVRAGQPIGGKRMVTVPNPAQWRAAPKAGRGDAAPPAVQPTIQQEVDFNTGAIAVEFDFQHKYPRPGLPKNTTLKVLYMDYLGQLDGRVLEEDRSSKRRKELDGEVKAAEAAAAEAVSTR